MIVSAADVIDSSFDEELFNLARRDDYAGIYHTIVARMKAQKIKPEDIAEAHERQLNGIPNA